MKTGKKIWLCIVGILLIAMGVYCFSNPSLTMLTTAQILGIGLIVTGITEMVFTFRTQAFLPFSGTRMLSGLLDILFGCFILFHIFGAAISIPMVFAIWVVIEGISVSVQSFDYKKAGFRKWWLIFILGVCATVLGFYGMRNLAATAATLSIFIGIALILSGLGNIFAVIGVSRLENTFRVR